MGANPAATAAAEPEDEPAGVCGYVTRQPQAQDFNIDDLDQYLHCGQELLRWAGPHLGHMGIVSEHRRGISMATTNLLAHAVHETRT